MTEYLIYLSIINVLLILSLFYKAPKNKIYSEKWQYICFFAMISPFIKTLLFAVEGDNKTAFAALCLDCIVLYGFYLFYINNRLYTIESQSFQEIDQSLTDMFKDQNYTFVRSEPFKNTVKFTLKNLKSTEVIILKFTGTYCTLTYKGVKGNDLINYVNERLAHFVTETPMQDKMISTGMKVTIFLLPVCIFIEAILIYKKFN